MPLFICILFICLVDEIVRLVTGCYCNVVMYTNIICNVIQLSLTTILLKVLPLWNPSFADEILAYKGRDDFAKGDILRCWGSEGFNNVLLVGACILTLIEVLYTVYKTKKYS